MPRLYVVDRPEPNAFATGRDPAHAAVAVTTGILDVMDERELRGVLAHELSHVKNRDTLIGTIAATIGGAVSFLAQMAQFQMIFGGGRDDRQGGGLGALVAIILAPLAAVIIQLAVSRGREYEADRGGAEISGDPAALADALAKMERYTKGLPLPPAEEHPATAQMMIVNPLHDGGLAGLFSTHPPIEERIRRLLALASQYQRGLQPR